VETTVPGPARSLWLVLGRFSAVPGVAAVRFGGVGGTGIHAAMVYAWFEPEMTNFTVPDADGWFPRCRKHGHSPDFPIGLYRLGLRNGKDRPVLPTIQLPMSVR